MRALTTFICLALLKINTLQAQSEIGSLADTGSIRIPVTEIDLNNIKSEAGMNEWRLLSLPRTRPTRYSLVKEEDENFLMAESNNEASGLYYSLDVDPIEFPVLEWTWKIEDVIADGDMMTRSGDDYPARIYLTFEYDRKDLPFGERIKYGALKALSRYEIPLRSLNYIWSGKYNIGSVAPSSYTPWVYMVVAESGSTRTGEWITIKVNVLKDFIEAFQEQPGKITGIVIMTDTDDTGSSAKAYYKDIYLKKD